MAEAFLIPVFNIVAEMQISSCASGIQMVETSVSFMFLRVMLDKMNLFGGKCAEI